MKYFIATCLIAWVTAFFVEKHDHKQTKQELAKTKSQLNGYKVKLFECAHALNRCEGER
jgi:hypothetical protein